MRDSQIDIDQYDFLNNQPRPAVYIVYIKSLLTVIKIAFGIYHSFDIYNKHEWDTCWVLNTVMTETGCH